ncbi:MAG: YibE/F family protein [Firmicutes bacterium]|jgi:uncharacterized membrane protein|nr:YibE/F family protein [Bacillota bacterium]
MKKPAGIMIVLLLMLVFAAAGSAQEAETYSTYEGRVLTVEILEPQPFAEEGWENQLVTVKLLSGPDKGREVQILHTLTGHPYFDLRVREGQRVILQADESGPAIDYFLADLARTRPLLAITALFILLVMLIGGRQGVKAILSLVGMGVVIVTMILPLILRGFNPIVVTVGLCSLLTGLFILFVTGPTKKTAAAIAGTVGGLLAAGLLALAVGKASFLTGLSSGEAQMLSFMDTPIDFQGLLFSGIIVGALGAILDVGISIASAMEQIKEADPETDFTTLFTRGILVGRDMIATMSNTLILAYVGSSLPLLLLFQVSSTSWKEVFNLDMVASEVVRAMAGSIGLTLAIPITALVSAFLFVHAEHKSKHLSH